MYQPILEFLRGAQRLAVVSHSGPDGDSLGSSLGLSRALRQLGKSVDVLGVDPVPPAYRFLPGSDTLRQAQQVEGEYDGVVILECSDFQRTGLKGLEGHFTVNIDHHLDSSPFADLNWVDPSAAAVGLMALRLIDGLGARVTCEVASCLYVALLTDTGSFQYSNTDGEAFQAAARLVECGADPGLLSEKVYRRQPLEKIKLLGHALGRLKSDRQRRIAWVELTQRDLKRHGAAMLHTEGIVNYPLALAGIRAAAVLREDSRGDWRISLRSKGRCDIGALASELGGGGHLNAAGVTLSGPLEDVRERVLEGMSQAVQEEAAPERV